MKTREEQIKIVAQEYVKGILGWNYDKRIAFENGAKWADNNPKFKNMETKEIIIPQGWKIDKVKGNKIILKESKKKLPKTWRKCLEQLNKGEYIDSLGIVQSFEGTVIVDHFGYADNTIPIGIGKPMLALCKLLVCREVYRQGWKPDWNEAVTNKYTIYNFKNKIETDCNNLKCKILSFQSEEVRDQFLENFRDLIEEAKELI